MRLFASKALPRLLMRISGNSRADLPRCQKLLHNQGTISPRIGVPAAANPHSAFATHPLE
ncbi:MAG TPA: hypothetical protein DEG78_02165 [Rhodobacteraceae bacterium]|nr:hypothetical protein [Paracoccaceae bacterium]